MCQKMWVQCCVPQLWHTQNAGRQEMTKKHGIWYSCKSRCGCVYYHAFGDIIKLGEQGEWHADLYPLPHTALPMK
jgi:hypothetical protein